MFRLILVTLAIAVLGCRTKSSSNVKVANGMPALDNAFNNPVQKLWDPTRGDAYCSLGFVHDQVAFTALHCVHSGSGLLNSANIAVQLPNGQFVAAQKIHVHPTGTELYTKFNVTDEQRDELLRQAAREDSRCERISSRLKQQIDANLQKREEEYMAFAAYDFAILVFPAGTGRAFVGDGPYYGLNPEAAKSGRLSGVKHIGYGHDKALGERRVNGSCDVRGIYEGFGERREGYNTNMQLTDGGTLFQTSGYVGNPRGQALTLGGDSGSIWVACYEGNCDQMDAIAVTNGGGKASDGSGTSIGPNIFAKPALEIMKLAVECGTNGPCAPKFRGYDETINGKSSGVEKDIAILVTGTGNQYHLSLGIKSTLVDKVFVCESDKVEAACNNEIKTKAVTLHDRQILAKVLPLTLKTGSQRIVTVAVQAKDQRRTLRSVKIEKP